MIADDRFPSNAALSSGRLPDWHGWHCEPGELPASERIGGVVSTLTVDGEGPGATYALAEPTANGFSALRGSMPRSYLVRPR